MREIKKTSQKTKKPPWIDRFVGYLSPTAGLERAHARTRMELAQSYKGAGVTRMTRNWSAGSSDPDTASRFDRLTLIDRSRDRVRNDPIATGAINTVVSHAVGVGLTHHPRIDGDFLGLSPEETAAKEDELERWFGLWSESKSCDIRRSLNFKELQSLALRSVLEGGDCFALLPRAARVGDPFRLRVQLIEAERVSNENNGADSKDRVAGIMKYADGSPKAYQIANRHPGNYIHTGGTTWTTIPAFGAKTGRPNILHLMDPLRPEQSRGVPYLSPVLDTLKTLSDLTEAELSAAVITSLLTVFVKSETGEGLLQTVPESSQTNTTTEIELGKGSIIDLAEGESIETVDPKRPNALFDPFFQAICRQMGVALEIPFEVLIGHFTASFSASQAAMLSAWRSFNRRRTWLSRNFCEPTRAVFVDELVARGMFSAPGYFSNPLIRQAYLGGSWHGESKGSLKAFDEAKANQLYNQMGVKSLKEITTEVTGKDWNNTKEQIMKERAVFGASEAEEDNTNTEIEENEA